VADRAIEFAIGGALILMSLIPIGLAILSSATYLNTGALGNLGGIGIAIGLIGFYLIGSALFTRE
jgi:hypothetical protein